MLGYQIFHRTSNKIMPMDQKIPAVFGNILYCMRADQRNHACRRHIGKTLRSLGQTFKDGLHVLQDILVYGNSYDETILEWL